jgi:hypothetical protein
MHPQRGSFSPHNLLSVAEKLWGNLSEAAVHFFEVEYTTAVKGLPHSKQLAFSRDVINPQEGHILCDPDLVTCGFALRIQWRSRIVTSTISRPRKMPVAFIKRPFLASPAPNGTGRPFTR